MPNSRCPHCNSELPVNATDGLCPKCLLGLGLGTAAAGRHLHIRCPNCQVPIEVLDDAPLLEVTCPSCDSRFSLAGDPTISYPRDKPQQVGQFELLECVGTGGFGSVWKAHDTELQRTVAIKVPRSGLLSATETEQFLREARVAAQLRHPNIVSVHEVGRIDGQLYIVSDFIAGVTLADYLSNHRCTIRESAQLCLQIAEAIQHAHEHGVIHRDLKPSNILLEREPTATVLVRDFDSTTQPVSREAAQASPLRPHITDFGLARRESGEVTITADGRILGTPAYMAPEQARGEGHRADARSDIYSLGVILFEVLTGEKPFRGTSRMLLDQVLHDDAPSPRKLNAAIPRDLETICLKCLEKDPSRRYESTRALAEEFRRFLHGEPIRARPISRTQRVWRWCQRNPTIAGLMTAVMTLLLFVFVLVAWQGRRAVAERINADRRRQATEKTLDESRGRLARLFVERGLQHIDVAPHAGLPWLIEALRNESPNSSRADIQRLRMAVMLQQVPQLVRFWPGARDAKFSPDGSLVAVAVGREAFIFNLATMDRIGPLVHSDLVTAVYFTPTGDRIVTLARHGPTSDPQNASVALGRVWDARTGKPLTEAKRLDDPSFGGGAPPSLQFTPDGERLLAINHHLLNRHYVRMSVQVFACRNLELLADKFAFHHNDEYLDFILSPDRTRIFTLQGVPFVGKKADEEDWNPPRGLPQLWDLVSGKAIFPPLDHGLDYTGSADYSSDGRLLVTSDTERAKVWDAQTGGLIHEFTTKGSGNAKFYADGKSLFITGDGHTWWWDIASGMQKDEWIHNGSFILDPSGQSVLWNEKANGASYIKNVRVPESPEVHLPNHRSALFGPGGSHFVFQPEVYANDGSYSTVVDIRRASDGFPITPPWRFTGQLSQQGRHYLCIDDQSNSGVWLWDLASKQKLVQPFVEKISKIRDVAFSQDRRTIAVLARDQTISVWDADTGDQKSPSIPLAGDWRWMQISPDSRVLAVVGNGPNPPKSSEDTDHEKPGAVWRSSRQVQLWDLGTGQSVSPVLSFPDNVDSVMFTRDSRRLLVTEIIMRQEQSAEGGMRFTINDHTRLHVINVSAGSPARPPIKISASFHPIRLSEDGEKLLALRRDESSPVAIRKPPLDRGAGQLWNTTTWEPLTDPMVPISGDVSVAALTPDASRVIIGTDGGVAEVWDAATGRRLVQDLRHPNGSIDQILFDSTGQSFCTVAGTNNSYGKFEIRRWSQQGLPISSPVVEPRQNLVTAGLSPDGRIAVVANSHQLRLWELETGLKMSPVIQLESEQDYPRELSRHPYSEIVFSANGRRCYVEANDALWMVPLGQIADSVPSLEKLQAWGELLSGYRIDAAGAYVRMTAEDCRQAWTKLGQ